MSRLKELFAGKNKRVLNTYVTAGYPKSDSTLRVMGALQESGADIIELGMPYSDPLADGPVIQHSSTIALQQGMSIARLFEQLKNFRSSIHIPVVLMGYMNPVLQYGFERFCSDAKDCGIDGLILPDLPEYEFDTEYGAIIRKYELDFIFLITPETSDERVRRLDTMSSGFLYAVSSSSTTGSDTASPAMSGYLQKLGEMKLKNPFLVGFGIKDAKSFEAACTFGAGAIIGTALIKALENAEDETVAVKQFINSILTPA
jgi:tryptophan synthase alpha chain